MSDHGPHNDPIYMKGDNPYAYQPPRSTPEKPTLTLRQLALDAPVLPTEVREAIKMRREELIEAAAVRSGRRPDARARPGCRPWRRRWSCRAGSRTARRPGFKIG